jgi:Na+/proline symporter
MTQKEFDLRIDQINEVGQKRYDKSNTWIRTLITITVGLFGILISFKNNEDISPLQSIFFIVSISSLGLGILFALVALYAEVHLLTRQRKRLVEWTKMQLNQDDAELEFGVVNPAFFYTVSFGICLVLYLIALFALISYSVLGEIKNIC